MEITPAGGLGGIVEHSSSRQSESSEIDKMIGSAHVVQKSSSFEEEESSKMVSQSVSQVETRLEDNRGDIPLGPPTDMPYMPEEPVSRLQDIPETPEVTPQLPQSDYPESAVEEIIPKENKAEKSNCVDCSRKRLSLSDKQTSTTSLEEQLKDFERESAAECLLRVLSREATQRPSSLPSDLASLWQSLKIASELNKVLKDTQEESDTEGSSGLQNGGPKPIDLQKLFTPASDADEIQPRNKKMFASSSFYGPNHPTMEEQVELARRISSSLSDISNKESKGQSMYVNRKKRSVKWVHQGEEQLGLSEFSEISHSENLPPTPKGGEKPILKLVMNPRGQVQDFNSLRGQAVDATPSPEVCFDLVKDLNSPCGKGAELFAKRRKKAESWVVDESNVKTSSELTSMSSYESNFSSQTSQMQLGKLATPTFPPNMSSLPTLTYMKDIPARFAPTAAKNQIPDKYTQPKVRLIKSPWEAALEGSVDSAFLDNKAPAAPSPTPRGQVLIAPLPSSFNKMATPPPPQPYVPPQDLYTAKPPKAWHPQPTGKQFSSVKLEQIFAGSPKSPVSLAYHADTNTISSEPVVVENVPSIAAKLFDYEIIDPSILVEQKTRRPDQILADVKPASPRASPAGMKWPPTTQEQDMVGSVIWSASTANWSKAQPEVKWPPEPPQETLSPSQQKVQWPPQQVQEDVAPTAAQLPFDAPYIPQPTSTTPSFLQQNPQPIPAPQPKISTQQLPTPQKAAVFVPSQVQKRVAWSPQLSNIASMSVEENQEQSMKSSLQHSLSEIQTAMTQACQNFTTVESSETLKTESLQSSHQEIIVAQESQSIKRESEQVESQSDVSTFERTQKSDALSTSTEATSHNESAATAVTTQQDITEAPQPILNELTSQNKTQELSETLTAEKFPPDPVSVQSNAIGSQKVEEVLIQNNEVVQEFVESKTQTEVSEKVEVASKVLEIQKEQPAEVSTSGEKEEVLSFEQLVAESQATVTENGVTLDFVGPVKTAINGFTSGNESSQSTVQKSEEILQSSQTSSEVSFKKEEISSISEQQMTMQSQTSSTQSVFGQKQIQESMSSSNKSSQFFGSQTMNGVKSDGFSSMSSLPSFNASQLYNSFGKSEFKSMQQESQISETASNRVSLSVLSTTDEEVQDLCEREFNQASMQYEKVNKLNIKKPAAVLPGAVKVFPTGNDFTPFTPVAKFEPKPTTQPPVRIENQNGAVVEPLRKTYKKPASMVPGARALFGEAVELHLGPSEGGEYEKIPVKNLIKTFEESTRPLMKYKTKEQETSTRQQQCVPHSSLLHQEQNQSTLRTSLYETFPSDIPSFPGGNINSQPPPVNKDWIQVPTTPQQNSSSAASNIHVDLSNVNNFNTAPRGWKSNMNVYKPITFSTLPTAQQFTDF